MAHVKPSHLAGSWYPSDAGELRAQVDSWLDEAAVPATQGRLRAVVVPHAGYRYSGRAAAAGYAHLRAGHEISTHLDSRAGNARSDQSCPEAPRRGERPIEDTPSAGHAGYARAVILAPSHHAAFRGFAVLDVAAFGTPLGEAAVDRAAVAALARAPLCMDAPEAYDDEHSLEIQVPFLQRALPGVPIVPVLLGSLDAADYSTVAAALAAVADERSVLVVSSDFVHYGRRFGYLPFPAREATQVAAALRSLDMGAIEPVCAGDAGGFLEYIERTGATICGRVPIATFLTLHRQRTRGMLFSYYTSLDVTGDWEHSVSYASIGFPAP